MRVHHLDCVSMCVVGGHLMDGHSEGLSTGHLVCHCLLVEAGDKLVLVDTGFGTRDVADPHRRINELMLAEMRPRLRERDTALHQIRRLGFDPKDVRHILLTHLDFDHAGGLDDFPWAMVHLMRDERDSAARRDSITDRMRYRPQQWSTQGHWRVYDDDGGEPWYGFGAVRDLIGVPPEILMVPLIGHTLGHAGVAVDTGQGWLLHAGDAYFFHGEMDPRPTCPAGLRLYQRILDKDHRARLANQKRLRELRRDHADEVRLFCAHDAIELARIRQGVPAIEHADVPHLLPPEQPFA